MEQAILQFFESIRCPALDWVFAVFSFLGQTPVLTAMIAVTYWAISKRAGEFILFNVLSAAATNGAVKDAVRRPRPYVKGVVTVGGTENPLLGDVSSSYSFPSGHSQNGGAGWLATGVCARKKWTVGVGAIVTLLILLSRVYLGVHYPTDVLCGGLLALCGVLLWRLVFSRFYRGRFWIFFAVSALLCLCMLYAQSEDTAKSCGMAIGAAVGLLAEDKFVRAEMPREIWKRIVRLLLGFAVLAAVYVICKFTFPSTLWCDFARYALVLLAATFCVPLFFRAFGI